MPHKLLSIIGLSASLISSVVSAQMIRPTPPSSLNSDEAILYKESSFQGPALAISTGRPSLDIAWPVKSIRIQKGTWEVCGLPNFVGACSLYKTSANNIPTRLQHIQSLRPVNSQPPSQWTVIAKQHVRDKADKDIAFVADSTGYSEVKVCAERNKVRLRRAEMSLRTGQKQRLFLPLVLEAGQCSNPIQVLRAPQAIAHIAFDYETMTIGIETADVVVMAR